MQRIKGSILKSRMAFIRQQGGDEAVERVLQRLDPADRETLSGIVTSVGWFPFELGKKLDEAVVEVLGNGDEKFFLRLGAASAVQNLTGVHRHFIKEKDPQAFLEKTPMIYDFYYDIGHREYEKTGPKEGVITTYDAETFSEPDCLTVIGWYEQGLKMCGAVNVRITEEECRAKGGDVCRYRLKWS